MTLLCAIVVAQDAAAADQTRIVLFDGTSTDQWQAKDGGGPCPWTIDDDGALVVTKGNIVSKEKFRDCRLHLEFWLPQTPDIDAEQAKANSGVFLQDLFEIQILDSYQRPITKGSCGAIYQQKGADKNVSTKPGTWQTYDITYRAPRFDESGKITEKPGITVLHNGTLIHDDVEILRPTSGKGDAPVLDEPGPIRLQDHKHPVRFRNIWIEPLSAADDAKDDAADEIVLFDGGSKDGWKQCGPGNINLVDDVFVTEGGMGMLWYAERPFKDFVLRLQYKVEDKKDNAGVFVRFPDPGNDPWIAVRQGHEVQIKEGVGEKTTGAIYDFKGPDAQNSKPPGQWNDYEIKVVGQTYTVKVNGKQVNEFTSKDRPLEGYIGLQNHDPKSIVRYRDIRIQPLEGAQ